MSRGSTTLYVTGFGPATRARDLAYEFERTRITAIERALTVLRFAFVEYESRRDADDAYHELHNVRLGRDEIIKIEWARTPPSASWRFDAEGRRERPPRRDRDRSPRRRSRSSPPRNGRDRDRDGSPLRKGDRRDRDDRRRSRSPDDGIRDEDMKDAKPRRRSEDENGVGSGDEAPRKVEDELDTAE